MSAETPETKPPHQPETFVVRLKFFGLVTSHAVPNSLSMN